MRSALAFLALMACCTGDEPPQAVDLCRNAYSDACGRICSDAAPCPLGLRCAAGTCRADCTPSAGCPPGLSCSLAGICGNPMPGVEGTPCSPDGRCPSGWVCSGTSCRERCSASRPCATGEFCASDGMCRRGVLLSDARTVTDPDAVVALEDGCIRLDVPVERQTPTVVLLVDESSTMGTGLGDAGATRWTLVRDALLLPPDGVVSALRSEVRFGLVLYTSHNGGPTCPIMTKVAPAIDNYDAIEQTWAAAGPIEDTPTAAAIRATAADLALSAEPGPRYILLVTDGLPDTCDDPDPASSDAQQAANQLAVDAAAAAYAQGVGVIVMGVSSEIAPTHLAQIANAGAGFLPTTSPGAGFSVASESQSDLALQFGTIVGTVRSCVLMLNGTVTPANETSGVVKLGDRMLGYGDADGYKLDTPSQIELLGTACDTFRAGGVALGVSFPCDAFIPR